MSAIDIIRSFAEARSEDDEVVKGITYGVCREAIQLFEELEKELNEEHVEFEGRLTVLEDMVEKWEKAEMLEKGNGKRTGKGNDANK